MKVAYLRHPDEPPKRCLLGKGTELSQVPRNLPVFIFHPFHAQTTPVFCRQIEDIQPVKESTNTALPKLKQGRSSPEKPTYLEKVTDLIGAINRSTMEKCVFSRQIRYAAHWTNEQKLHLFFKLCDAYPHALCYLFEVSESETWIGATPELLLKAGKHEVTSTSLAGTLPNKGPGASYNWTAKEVHEQQVVTDYIKACFQQGQVETLKVKGPETVLAGSVVHLQSEIRGTYRSFITIPNLLQNLHPTPAVAGLPKDKALAYILKAEQQTRSYYTGYLGIMEPENTSLFVNLRCMRIVGEKTTIFVGGGITGDSSPEAEWNETVEKSKTLLNVINGR